MPISSHPPLSSPPPSGPLSQEVGTKKKSNLLGSHFFLELLIMTFMCLFPTPPLTPVHFDLVLWSHFCVFPILIFVFLECGKLEGDLTLCPLQGGGEAD